MSYAMWCGSYRLRHPTSKDVDGMAHGSCSTWYLVVHSRDGAYESGVSDKILPLQLTTGGTKIQKVK